MSSKPLKILFAIAEAYPFIKVGGLADVGASLPKALARLGHDVRLVLPGYPCVGAGRPTVSLATPMGSETELAHVDHHGVHGDVSVYAVGNERYFDRESAYGGYEDDDVAPFVLFSKAVVAFAAHSEWKPTSSTATIGIWGWSRCTFVTARTGRRWVVRGRCSPSTTSPIRDTSDRRRRRSPGWKTARAACWLGG